jgi:hypothetical protein
MKKIFTGIFGEPCENIEEFVKFLTENERLLQTYPEKLQMKVLSFKFPDQFLNELIHAG